MFSLTSDWNSERMRYRVRGRERGGKRECGCQKPRWERESVKHRLTIGEEGVCQWVSRSQKNYLIITKSPPWLNLTKLSELVFHKDQFESECVKTCCATFWLYLLIITYFKVLNFASLALCGLKMQLAKDGQTKRPREPLFQNDCKEKYFESELSEGLLTEIYLWALDTEVTQLHNCSH